MLKRFLQIEAPDTSSDETLNESLPSRRQFWVARDGEHAYLEEVEGKQAIDFVLGQNEKAIKCLGEPKDSEVYKQVLTILESKDKIPHVHKVGPFLYNFWDDDKSPRGILRRCAVDDFANASPAWETILDFAELGKQEGESWVYKTYSVYEPEDLTEAPRRILLHLSRGGGDKTVVREFDLIDKAFVLPGFVVPENKNWIQWLDIDTLIVGTDFNDGKSLTDSGYPRTARLWRRGTDLIKDSTPYFEGEQSDIGVSAHVSRHGKYKHQIKHRSITFYTGNDFVFVPSAAETHGKEQGEWVKVPKQDGATVTIFQDQALLELRSDWKVSNGTVFTAGSLIAAPLQQFLQLGASALFTVIFSPTESTSLYASTSTQNFLAITVLEHVKTRVYLWRLDRSEGIEKSEPRWILAGQEPAAAIRGISISALDSDCSDDVWVTTSSFTTPSTLSLVSLAACAQRGDGLAGLRDAPAVKSLPHMFDSSGVVEQQGMARSKDGTEVPYFLVCQESVLAAGNAPTLLYGYGGFEISLPPAYGGATGKSWIEKGGCYVVANIRGGGEYGPRWHKAALREKRERAYDDFIAVAEDLVQRGITSPRRLGIRGGSNGGLLMGNMLTRRPDLFGAVICQVPLLDMRRYHKLLAGASWTAEYGDPSDPEDWKFLQCVSAYHNIDPVSIAGYPALLMLTSTRDDRVHPYHARAFVRRLLDVREAEEKRLGVSSASGTADNVLSYENMEGGHGGAADLKQQAYQIALYSTFLWSRLRK